MSIIGKWNISVSTPMGTVPSTLTLNADGTGQASSRLGSSDLNELRFDGNSATFTVKIQVMGQEMVLDGSAVADADSITGKYVDSKGLVSTFEGNRVE